jgi:hypothetical protein
MESLNKHVKCATAQTKISPLNESVVMSIIKQITVILSFLSRYAFNHGKPCLEYIRFTNKHCNYKYGEIIIDSPITVHLEPSFNSSISFETDLGISRICYNNDMEKIPNFANIPVEHIDITITEQMRSLIKKNNDIIPSFPELEGRLVYCYKIGNKLSNFVSYNNRLNIPIVNSSFDFYCFLISLLFEDSFYTTFMENIYLKNIWSNLWKKNELDSITKEINALKTKDELYYEEIAIFLSKYYLRTDAVKYFIDSLSKI